MRANYNLQYTGIFLVFFSSSLFSLIFGHKNSFLADIMYFREYQ